MDEIELIKEFSGIRAQIQKLLYEFLKIELPKLGSNWWNSCVINQLTETQKQNNPKDLKDLDLICLLQVFYQNLSSIRFNAKINLSFNECKERILALKNIRHSLAHDDNNPIEIDKIKKDLLNMKFFLKMIESGNSTIEGIEKLLKSIEKIDEPTPPINSTEHSLNLGDKKENDNGEDKREITINVPEPPEPLTYDPPRGSSKRRIYYALIIILMIFVILLIIRIGCGRGESERKTNNSKNIEKVELKQIPSRKLTFDIVLLSYENLPDKDKLIGIIKKNIGNYKENDSICIELYTGEKYYKINKEVKFLDDVISNLLMNQNPIKLNESEFAFHHAFSKYKTTKYDTLHYVYLIGSFELRKSLLVNIKSLINHKHLKIYTSNIFINKFNNNNIIDSLIKKGLPIERF